jgi:hypothetical protein
MAISFEMLSPSAKEVMGQMFILGPCWDGYIVSKMGRNELHDHKLIERGFGWQWLTRDGVEMAIKADVKQRADQRWRKKQIC